MTVTFTHGWESVSLGHKSIDNHLSQAVWQLRDQMIDARTTPANEAFADELEHLADVARTLEYYERGLLDCTCLSDGQPCQIRRYIEIAKHPESYR